MHAAQSKHDEMMRRLFFLFRRRKSSAEQPEGLIASMMVAVFLLLVFRLAWISDDAQISLRSVYNVVHGQGLRWNVSERVQAFTHPLWVLLFTPIYAITREFYFSLMGLSLSVSFLGVLLLQRAVPSRRERVWIVFLMILSPAFIQYSTSGLENPLSHLLVVLFMGAARNPRLGPRLFQITLVFALALCNRHDSLVLLLPPLVYQYLRHRRWLARLPWTSWLRLATAFTPFVAWEAFSLIYYGFPFPNTAYAKLNTGLPKLEIWQQGFLYFLDSLSFDPFALLLILSSLFWGIERRGQRGWRWGIALHLLYLLSVGGDFMNGRFLSVPFLVACVLMAHRFVPMLEALPTRMPTALVISALTMVALFAEECPLRAYVFWHRDAERGWPVSPRGIADERGVYASTNGLGPMTRSEPQLERREEFQRGRRLRQQALFETQKPLVTYETMIGATGLAAGPDVHIIDRVALADPLLARLPVRRDHAWRVGHYERAIPAGYEESIRHHDNRIQDPQLAKYYEHLRHVVSGPIWSAHRFHDMFNFLTRRYDHWIPFRKYYYAGMVHRSLAQVSTPKARGSHWNASDNLVFGESGIEIHLGKAVSHPRLEVSLDGNDGYRVEFFRGRQRVLVRKISPAYTAGLEIYRIGVQEPGSTKPVSYDRIRFLPVQGDRHYALGHLIF